MTYASALTVADTTDIAPNVRTITFADIRESLARGLDDFAAMPSHAVFLCLIYPIVGVVLGTLTLGYQSLPLLFPLASGFVLLGPVAAVGLYELSRRREQGLESAWSHAFDVLQSPSRGAIAMLGVMLVLVFGGWLVAAQTIYWGAQPFDRLSQALARRRERVRARKQRRRAAAAAQTVSEKSP